MNDGIVRLVTTPTVAANIKADAIDLLQTVLNKVISGEVKSVVVIYETADGGYGHGWTGCETTLERMGHMQLVQHKMNSEKAEADRLDTENHRDS